MSQAIVAALADALVGLSPEHQAGLIWYAEHANELVAWPRSQDGLLLATKARGIYKPRGSAAALSVREVLNSPFADRPPRYRPDGSWRYLYHQQGADVTIPRSQWDDTSLAFCWDEGIPVGVLRQVKEGARTAYLVVGVARVVDWFSGYFVLEGYPSSKTVQSTVIDFDLGSTTASIAAEESPAWNDGELAERRLVRTDIMWRRGQAAFRASLLDAYGRLCAVTGCNAAPVLEAAHIATFPGADGNAVSNGLLLRADIHTLFDLGLVAVHDRDSCLLVAPELENTEYAERHGTPLHLPIRESQLPDPEALRRHRVWAGL